MEFLRLSQTCIAAAFVAGVSLLNTSTSYAAEPVGNCFVQADDTQAQEASLSHCAMLIGEKIADSQASTATGRWEEFELRVDSDGSYSLIKEGQTQGPYFWDTEKLVDNATNDIDDFWRREFESRGWDYTSPDAITGYTRRTRTACGRAVLGNAFYCQASNSIFYDVNLLKRGFTNVGDYAPVAIIAHEWGHAIQELRGYTRNLRRSTSNTLKMEQMADCMSGAYTQDAEARGALNEGDVAEANELFRSLGGDRSHGTAKQRVAAFQKGLKGGVDACVAGWEK
jgi:hypothetical protein